MWETTNITSTSLVSVSELVKQDGQEQDNSS